MRLNAVCCRWAGHPPCGSLTLSATETDCLPTAWRAVSRASCPGSVLPGFARRARRPRQCRPHTSTSVEGSHSAFGHRYVVEDVPEGTGGANPQRPPTGCGLHRHGVHNVTVPSRPRPPALLRPTPRTRPTHPASVSSLIPRVRIRADRPDGRCRPSWVDRQSAADKSTPVAKSSRRAVLTHSGRGRFWSLWNGRLSRLLGPNARVFGHVDSTYFVDLGTPVVLCPGRGPGHRVRPRPMRCPARSPNRWFWTRDTVTPPRS